MRFSGFGKVIFLFLFLFLSVMAFGQPDDPTGDPDAVPITGIELLIAGGSLLGGHKLLQQRRKAKNGDSKNP